MSDMSRWDRTADAARLRVNMSMMIMTTSMISRTVVMVRAREFGASRFVDWFADIMFSVQAARGVARGVFFAR
jgi:hypothetical protein